MQIIDAQVHIWGSGTPSGHHRQTSIYTAEELINEMDAAGVNGAVLHPPSWDAGSNEMAVDAATKYPDRFCILGWFPLDKPEERKRIETWKQRPGMLGLRWSLTRPEQENWHKDGTMDWVWPAAERAGTPIATMAWRFLPLFKQIAEQHPNLKLIIDHLGLVRSAKGAAAFADLDSLCALSKLPNVAVKATGAPGYSDAPYPFRDIHDGLHRIFDAYGPQRFFWGTDITRMPCSYRQCVTLFTEELPWLKGHDLEQVMGQGVCDWLGWKRSATWGVALLTDHTSYADAQRHFAPALLWELFDGDRERLNIAHECIDRYAVDPRRIAIRIAHADGHDEAISFRTIADCSSRCAHWLAEQGITPGDRVAIMLEPSLAFYATLFGVMKLGAIAVPLFTLFGPEGVRLRVDDCTPRLLLTTPDKAASLGELSLRVIALDDGFGPCLSRYPAEFVPTTRADDLAIFQYTSGTTRALPDAIRHTHRAIVVVMIAALYGTGIRPGDRFFCPSSPAWGHGLWHGTLAPLALGVETGVYAGRFDAERLLRALQDYATSNLSAAATHYRLMRTSGAASRYHYALRKLSFTGEPIDSDSRDFAERTFGARLSSMYGTTEVGVILANYPGAEDFNAKTGALGRPVPGVRVAVQRPDGDACPPGEIGEIKVWRHGAWFATKDRGWIDDDGYFFHAGRADDVIISAGWTMSAVEIEDVLLRHPAVHEVAVIGVPDVQRGHVVKAFVVTDRPHDDALVRDIQDFVRTRLSQHEYPHIVAFVAELPKTPAGKVNRRALREREIQEPP